jgi:malic enzyme
VKLLVNDDVDVRSLYRLSVWPEAIASAAFIAAELANRPEISGASIANRVPDVAIRIAHAVAVQAVADNVAPKRCDEQLTERIAQVRWTPEYPSAPT